MARFCFDPGGPSFHVTAGAFLLVGFILGVVVMAVWNG